MIKWNSLQDNHVEGKSGDTKFYIRLKKERGKLVTESLYIVPKEGDKRKIMSQEHGATTVEEMKLIAELEWNY
jgi:hypothetical protein